MRQLPSELHAKPQTVAAYLAVLRLARQYGHVITRIKLAKLLYLADLEAVKRGDDPISGVEWRWLQHGPFNNDLQFLETDLVELGAVSLTPYYFGYQIRLVDDVAGYDMDPGEMAILEAAMREFGGLAATSLKDLSYQTPPMIDAQQRGKNVVLDLSLARPRPRLGGLAKRMSAVLKNLPEQSTDPGVFNEIEEEMQALSDLRREATKALIDES